MPVNSLGLDTSSLRLEASNMVLFEEDDYQNVQSYTAGLGTYF